MQILVPVYTAIIGTVVAASVPLLSSAIPSPAPAPAPAVAAPANPPSIVVVSTDTAPVTSLRDQLSTQSADDQWLRPSAAAPSLSITNVRTAPIVPPPVPAPVAPAAQTAAAQPAAKAQPAPARERSYKWTTSRGGSRLPARFVDVELGPDVPAKIRKYEEIIQRHAEIWDVDPRLVAAVIMTESSGNPNAVSGKNAVGLMQVLDGPSDPEGNIAEGVRQLAKWLWYYGEIDLALAAYNAGPGNVQRYGGVPPFGETHAHISRTLASYQAYGAKVA